MPGREEEHQGGVSRRLVNERVFQRGIIGWRGEATLGGRVSAGFRFFVLIIIHTHTHSRCIYFRSFDRSIHPSVNASHVYNNKEWTETTPQLNPRARAFSFYTREISQKNTRRRRPIVNRRFKGGSRNRLYDDMTISCMYKLNVFWVYRYRYTTLFGRCL